MMDERKEPYIEQQAAEDALYTRLQQQTLAEVQRMSGKVWTDYNAHDPGVTLADIANYALAELDYKLGFTLADSLSEKGRPFGPERFGLHAPLDAYTTAPVTADDYRRLLLARIPELENVSVTCDKETGGYTFRLLLSPFEDTPEDIERQAKDVYNSHRNLCEHLDRVETVKPEELEFHADFEIEPGSDATELLAEAYLTILRYLAGSVRIDTPEKDNGNLPPEAWLEGSEDAVRVTVPSQKDTESELYLQLRGIEGIRSFATCYLMRDGEPVTDLSQGFSLKIPHKDKELKVRIRCGHTEVKPDVEAFHVRLETSYRIRSRIREKEGSRTAYGWSLPEGSFHDIYGHYPLSQDFPPCYRLSSGETPATPFEAYVRLYDKAIEDGLEESGRLPRALSIREEDFNLADKELKSRYLDFLDKLYGVETWPDWLKESGGYGETEEEALLRRTDCLRHIARLLRDRSKGPDCTTSEPVLEDGRYNVATAKERFCRLLGINMDEGKPSGNVLPGHNLILMRESEKGMSFRDKLSARLIDEKLLDTGHVEAVTPVALPAGRKETLEQYALLRKELPVFNHNFIHAGLFRGGIRLSDYRIVPAAESEWMLVFRNREENVWMNLGRTDDRIRLNLLANILRRYLLELNRACETLYIVEPVLGDPKRPFTLWLVLPSWTARFHAPRFREACRTLLRSLLPAHLTGTIYWMDCGPMQEFEDCYLLWRKALERDYKEDAAILLDHINELLNQSACIQPLDDTD